METQPATAIQARIIVVNDDVTQLRIFVGLLSKHGYTTEGFSEVTTALERMEAEGAPDLIITDLYMPGIDGWRFCRLLRSPEYAALNQTPILVNSATFTGRDAEKITAELGANAFLPSPVRGAELLQRVQQLLTRRAPLPLPRVLIVEDDPDIASVLESIYRVHGYHADAVASGSAARGKFAAIPYDLAVIDYHLPDLLGDCLLREFQVLRPDAVYIMTTGDMQPRLAVEWMKLGASAYVHKPFDPDYLYAVSENARRERALLRIPALLEDRTQELRKSEALLAQAQKMDSIGRLAGGVAHDFNNMLGVILGHAEMALAEVDPAAQLHDHLVEIQKAAMRSADLTRQLLAFARRQTVSPRVIDLNETVSGMLKMLKRLIGENIELDWLPGGALWPIKIDPAQVDQILANLCVNARDAIRDVGRITIETANAVLDEADCTPYADALPGHYVMLAVRDTGCGMTPEVRGHIFEPFYTTKGPGAGTGLGLATVYGVVRQNGGFITVESAPGAGSTFRIYLAPHEGAPAPIPAGVSADAVLPGHETILLVEDEAAILSLGEMVLSRLGYTVLTAATPGDALRLAEAHVEPIDLIVTDVVMPEMNGRDLVKRLMPLYPQVKCLFMSGYTADIIAPHGLLDEGVNFIQKPFTMQLLSARVREMLDA